MVANSQYGSEWTGVKGRIMAWYLNSVLRRLSDLFFLGNARSRVVVEVESALGGRGVVLDVGAGSGYFSLAIAPRLDNGKVIALDLSPEMLRRLEGAAQKRGLVGRLEILEGSAYEIGLDDASVDVAMANGVLHELVDPGRALREMVRVLRQGGRAIVTDFRADTWVGRRIASGHRPEDHGPFSPEELKMLFVDAGLRDVQASAMRHLVMAVGSKP